MVTQPVLDNTMSSLGDVRYTITYHDDYLTPDDPRLDESHIHGCYEIYFNISGDVSFLVNNSLYSIQSGDVIITRPGDVHICIYHKACVHEHFCLWVSCSENSAVSEFFENTLTHIHCSFGEKRDKLVRMFRNILCHSTPDLRGAAALLGLLAFLGEKNESVSITSKSSMPSAMQEIVDYINEHFYEIHHVNDILERYYISQATLNRWFRQYVHLSPKEFLEAKKLSYAKTLLSSGISVTDVCLQSGFNDCSHFIAVFKKRFGETPLRYKKRLL